MKKTVAVLFGGRSSEHEVSCKSACTIIGAMDKEKYNTILIGITKDGRWLYVENTDQIKDGTWRESKRTAILSPDASQKGILVFDTEFSMQSDKNGQLSLNSEAKANSINSSLNPIGVTLIPVDVIFPALHGLYGEDGTVQGVFELAQIPYVGCGVLASAVSMDKVYTKQIVEKLGIRQAQFVDVRGHELGQDEMLIKRVEEKLSYPVFIKPSNAGSSCGVTKAHNREELLAGLALAAKHDRKILVEENICGRELECAVLGGAYPETTGIGEILAAAEFYDYDAKYNNAESKTVIDPELPEGKCEEIREAAAKIFKAVDGFGLSRVDFFMENGTNEIIFNEINTLPGFTAISMYPMLWEKQGISKPELVDRLIALALERGTQK